MKKRYFGLAINVVFYGILLFNWYVTANYGADYLVHAGVVIFLWLSYMEKESFEKIKYWIISDCIFITKFFMIIIQILFLSYGLQDIYYYVLFAFCCIATFITEMFLIRTWILGLT